MTQQQKGITLIQFLVLMGTIGLVVLVSAFWISKERSKTRDHARISNIKQIQASIEMFYSQQGSYPSIAQKPVPEGSGHNWLPDMSDHGIQTNFSMFLPQALTASLPADSSVCRASKPCNGDNATIANDFCYTAYPEGCSAAGAVKCHSYLLDFCLGSQTGGMREGFHEITQEGIK